MGNYPSLPSKVFSTYTPRKPESYAHGAMASQAQSFLKSLEKNLRQQASLPYDSPEKAKWTNVPPRGPQGGPQGPQGPPRGPPVPKNPVYSTIL